MTKARTIAELHYPNKAGNRFDEKHRQSRINALEKLITKQLTLTDVSQQRELLELVTEIANSKQDYSNTRHKLWAKKLIGSNCG